MSFYRDHQGHEVDLLVERGDATVAVEVKSGQTVSGEFFGNLSWLAGQQLAPAGTRLDSILVYGGDERQRRTAAAVVPWFAVHEIDW
jgi:hypothetical protein